MLLSSQAYANPEEENLEVMETQLSGEEIGSTLEGVINEDKKYSNPFLDETQMEETTADALIESALTPTGNATIINDIKSGNKEFYTIQTADGNVFYLVIDRSKEKENVYFLDSVQEKDLLALAKEAGQLLEETQYESTEAEIIEYVEESTETLEQRVDEQMGAYHFGSMILLLGLVMVAVAFGYYFKVYRQEKVELELEDELEDEVEDEVEDELDSEKNSSQQKEIPLDENKEVKNEWEDEDYILDD